MYCPKCRTSELRVSEASIPQSCPKCGGLWLESDSLSKLGEIADLETGGHNNPVHDTITGLCPQEHGILIRAKISGEPPFYLERCATCGGIWFDKGEWKKILDAELENNLVNLWSRSWQKKQRLKLKEEEIKQMYKDTLGEEVYTKIVGIVELLKSHPNRYSAVELLKDELEKK